MLALKIFTELAQSLFTDGSFAYVLVALIVASGALYVLLRHVAKMRVARAVVCCIGAIWVPAYLLVRTALFALFLLPWLSLVGYLAYRLTPAALRDWCRKLADVEAGAGGGVDREERRRIGAMVEEGRITASEACDLLDALGRNGAVAGEKDTMGFADFLAIAATGLVALGFFLPWVKLGLPVEVADLMRVGGAAVGTQAGYNLGALGWGVLCLGVLLTVPVFVTAAKVLLKVHVVQLVLTLVGMAVVLSLLWRAGDAACSGLFVCALGFIMGIAAAVINVRKVVR